MKAADQTGRPYCGLPARISATKAASCRISPVGHILSAAQCNPLRHRLSLRHGDLDFLDGLVQRAAHAHECSAVVSDVGVRNQQLGRWPFTTSSAQNIRAAGAALAVCSESKRHRQEQVQHARPGSATQGSLSKLVCRDGSRQCSLGFLLRSAALCSFRARLFQLGPPSSAPAWLLLGLCALPCAQHCHA